MCVLQGLEQSSIFYAIDLLDLIIRFHFLFYIRHGSFGNF